ncbi:MAG: DTW domain-containing protein YfiP [Pseudohongiellaceae bacterium]|jgi:DTW domain-containing protein YfiP
MTLYLLTHERELNKATNTGQLVKKCLGGYVKVIIWRRKEPDLNLVELINQGKVAMLFPEQPNQNNLLVEKFDDKAQLSESVGLNVYNDDRDNGKGDIKDFEVFVILDSTWQEARKMYKRSAYLQQAKKISLHVDEPSTYRKRRNQIEGGLSTAECVIALLKQKNKQTLATVLQQEYDVFNLS